MTNEIYAYKNYLKVKNLDNINLFFDLLLFLLLYFFLYILNLVVIFISKWNEIIKLILEIHICYEHEKYKFLKITKT